MKLRLDIILYFKLCSLDNGRNSNSNFDCTSWRGNHTIDHSKVSLEDEVRIAIIIFVTVVILYIYVILYLHSYYA